MDHCATRVAREDSTATDISTEVGSVSSDSAASDGCDAALTPAKTLIIFDWDDTLFPTTWLVNQGLICEQGLLEAHVTPEQDELLHRLAEGVSNTLRKAMQYGKVVIVTNAVQDWVEYSCAAFMPSVCSIIDEIKIISARSTYESVECSSPSDWKRRAFAREFDLFREDVPEDIDAPWCIVSLGDALHEQEALASVSSGIADCVAKSLKFMERPQVEQMAEQHELVLESFAEVVGLPGDLDLEVANQD
jgi:hypothetical protein